MSGSAAPV